MTAWKPDECLSHRFLARSGMGGRGAGPVVTVRRKSRLGPARDLQRRPHRSRKGIRLWDYATASCSRQSPTANGVSCMGRQRGETSLVPSHAALSTELAALRGLFVLAALSVNSFAL